MNIYPRPSISSFLSFPFISRAFSTLLDNNTTHKKKQGYGANKRSNKPHVPLRNSKTLSTFALVMYNSTSRTNSKTKLVSMMPTHSKPRIKANNI